jgi:hypothetical protein
MNKRTLTFMLLIILLAIPAVTTYAQPLNAPGGLCVRVDRQQLTTVTTITLPDAQLIILDKSGSMDEMTRTGQRRIDLAQSVLLQYVQEMPDGSWLGLRAYGYDGSCYNETRMLYPVSPLNRPQLLSIISGIGYPDGKTPIADTLRYIPTDLQGISGVKEVLLVTDGQETCGGDPVAVARGLAAADPNLAIHVIGFDIDDVEAQTNLREIPRVARGTYIPAETDRDLLQALSVAIRVPFYVYDAAGRYMGEGLANRTTVRLDPGVYSVDVPDLGISRVPITVERGRGSSLSVDAGGRTAIIQNDGLCIAEFCPDVPLPRLVVGERGRVTFGDPRPVRVRSQPGLNGQILTQLALGEEFDVLDGPICADGYLWWYVRNGRTQGWSAEGVFGNYYLEPWF